MIELGKYVEEKRKGLEAGGYDLHCYVTFRISKDKYSARTEYLPEDAPKLAIDWTHVIDCQLDKAKSDLDNKKALYS